MLSLKRCREILGKDLELSDDELEALRAQLYQLGGVALEMADPQKPEKHAEAPEARGPAAASRSAVSYFFSSHACHCGGMISCGQIATIPEANRKIVTFHDAFAYLARDLNLEIAATLTIVVTLASVAISTYK